MNYFDIGWSPFSSEWLRRRWSLLWNTTYALSANPRIISPAFLTLVPSAMQRITPTTPKTGGASLPTNHLLNSRYMCFVVEQQSIASLSHGEAVNLCNHVQCELPVVYVETLRYSVMKVHQSRKFKYRHHYVFTSLVVHSVHTWLRACSS